MTKPHYKALEHTQRELAAVCVEMVMYARGLQDDETRADAGHWLKIADAGHWLEMCARRRKLRARVHYLKAVQQNATYRAGE